MAVWLEALTANRSYEMEHDRPRFKKAFATLCGSRRAWPVPQDFIDALPRRERLQLGYEIKRADPARAAAAIAECQAALTGKRAASEQGHVD